MAKRKQLELAADHRDGAVFDISGFGRFELLKGYFHANPVWKKRTCYDLLSSLPRFPHGQRSKRKFWIRNKIAPIDGSQESKREAKPSDSERDSEVICKRSPCYGRQSTRRHHRTTNIQKRGKLDSGKFEFYLENMWRKITEEKNNVFTYLDCLWFSSYSKGPFKEQVLSWIKKKDIFSKKYVFVPIVQWGHWFLLILCNFGGSLESERKNRCMLLLDSLKEANSKQLEPGIRRFVLDIFKTEERPEKRTSINKIPLFIPQVPQQKNNGECGFYVLYYIYLCLKSYSENFSFSMGYPHFMKEDWFTPQQVECFVEKLDSINKSSDCLD